YWGSEAGVPGEGIREPVLTVLPAEIIFGERSMVRRVFTGSLVVGTLLVVVAPDPLALGAPCVQACKPQIAACIGAECQGLKRRALRHCRRTCAKGIVKDCFSDLTVCGATTARPVRPTQPPATAPAPAPPTGGW